MKNYIVKIMNSNLTKVCMLVVITSLLPLHNASAQKKLYYANSGALIEVGDSVRINPDSLHYETGERKVKWVYDQVHEIRQVSSKYHPDGILVRGIYSWLKVGSIMPLNEKKVVKSDTILPELVTVKDSIDVEYVPDSISMEKPVVAPIVEDTIDSIPPVEPIEEEEECIEYYSDNPEDIAYAYAQEPSSGDDTTVEDFIMRQMFQDRNLNHHEPEDYA